MATNAINFLVMTIMFVVSILTPISVLAHYDTTTTPNPNPHTSIQSPGSCQESGQLCAAYGSYACCQGLECRVPAIGVGPLGAAICTPPLATKLNNKNVQPPQPPNQLPTGEATKSANKCQKIGNLCKRSGEYSCCEGLDCIYPPKVVGLGFCAVRGAPVLPQVDRSINGSQKCQKLGQICEEDGPTTCCKGLVCNVVRPAVGAGVCTLD